MLTYHNHCTICTNMESLYCTPELICYKLITPQKHFYKTEVYGTSLVVQWVRLRTPKARAPGLILGRGTRFCMLQLKSLQAASKSSHYTTRKSACHIEGPTGHN